MNEFAGGREQDFSYDEDGRNTVIEDTVPTQVQKFMVQFDGNGNRTVTNDANGALSTFTYWSAGLPPFLKTI